MWYVSGLTFALWRMSALAGAGRCVLWAEVADPTGTSKAEMKWVNRADV
jgi:hypothetical protein